jgi:hypothetical protein
MFLHKQREYLCLCHRKLNGWFLLVVAVTAMTVAVVVALVDTVLQLVAKTLAVALPQKHDSFQQKG